MTLVADERDGLKAVIVVIVDVGFYKPNAAIDPQFDIPVDLPRNIGPGHAGPITSTLIAILPDFPIPSGRG